MKFGTHFASPRPNFSLRHFVREVGIAQGRLNMLMPQSFTDRGQTHTRIDQLSGMRIPELMQGADDPGLMTVFFLDRWHGLIAQRTALIVFLSAEDWSLMKVTLAQIALEQNHDTPLDNWKVCLISGISFRDPYRVTNVTSLSRRAISSFQKTLKAVILILRDKLSHLCQNEFSMLR